MTVPQAHQGAVHSDSGVLPLHAALQAARWLQPKGSAVFAQISGFLVHEQRFHHEELTEYADVFRKFDRDEQPA